MPHTTARGTQEIKGVWKSSPNWECIQHLNLPQTNQHINPLNKSCIGVKKRGIFMDVCIDTCTP